MADEETDTSDFLEEELEVELFFAPSETVRSAAFRAQAIGMSPSAITVLSRWDIESSGATTIPDLLRLVPGMDVITTSPFYTAITSRLDWNNDNNRYLVLLDGREVNLELMGQAFWEMIPVTLNEIERIEVIRGPASAVYGANAFAGVINITTLKQEKDVSTDLLLLGGESGEVRAQGRIGARKNSWTLGFSTAFERSGTSPSPRWTSKRLGKLRLVGKREQLGPGDLTLDYAMSAGVGRIPTSLGTIDTDMVMQSVRLDYSTESLKTQLFWNWTPLRLNSDLVLGLSGVTWATPIVVEIDGHTLDLDFHWFLPKWKEELLFVLGGGARFSWVESGELLDEKSFADPASENYHQPGLEYSEGRVSGFFHSEWAPREWVTLTLGTRLDYNTLTGFFTSPRLVGIFRSSQQHFFRAGIARAFRKPAFLEVGLHPQVDFPPGSPLVGEQRNRFLEFMTRVAGNQDLDNENLWAFELGYLGELLERTLLVSYELFYNRHSNIIKTDQEIVIGIDGLPRLDESWVRYTNVKGTLQVIGSELELRYQPTSSAFLRAAWTHRQIIGRQTGITDTSLISQVPQNLLTLGGQVKLPIGLVSSLYLFSRSGFWDHLVQNPAGPLEHTLSVKMENSLLLLGRLSWIWQMSEFTRIEAGLLISQPFSLHDSVRFCAYDRGGGVDLLGQSYSGVLLCRKLSFFIQGQF